MLEKVEAIIGGRFQENTFFGNFLFDIERGSHFLRMQKKQIQAIACYYFLKERESFKSFLNILQERESFKSSIESLDALTFFCFGC